MKRLFACLFLACLAAPASAQQTLPTPRLHALGHEHYSTAFGKFVRYRFDVLNYEAFAPDLFVASPALPPCGRNTNSARSWVDFFNSAGPRIYGFCAITSPAGLNSLWFAVPEGTAPPTGVYIELIDRLTNRRARSNTVAPTPCLIRT